MRPLSPELAEPMDAEALLALESSCFDEERRDGLAVIRRSLGSPSQEVWVLRETGVLLGALILRKMARGLRIYSLAVAVEARGRGLGKQLLEHAKARASASALCWVSLEAEAREATLLAWYQREGFRKILLLRDYYAPGRDAWRMRYRVPLAVTSIT